MIVATTPDYSKEVRDVFIALALAVMFYLMYKAWK